MKIIEYKKIKPVNFDNEEMRGVAGRVVIGKNDGAKNFYMRIFGVAPGGYTHRHAHHWEHEVFVHAGEGECYYGGEWQVVKAGDVIFIPPDEEHQLRNKGKELFVFVCLIPANAPEL